MKGRTIRVYLIDGVPSGLLTAEIINWTGKVVVAPRSGLAGLKKRDEARRTGVYLLVGPDPDDPSRDRVYVGEADNVYNRLLSHDRDDSKDFWTRAAVIISKDENLTKAHARYLESRLISTIVNAGRAALHNNTNPDPVSMPEPDVADMEFFLDQVLVVGPVLGFAFLQPRADASAATRSSFELSVVGARANAIEVNDEFVVLKGATARKEGVESWTSFRKLRDNLVQAGKLADSDDPDFYVFTEDTSFGSPSAGAAVVAGRNINGRQSWKHIETGQSYGEWKEALLENPADDE